MCRRGCERTLQALTVHFMIPHVGFDTIESAGSTSNGDSPEPTMRDLRARIAKDLDMAEVILLLTLYCTDIVSLHVYVIWQR
jgi:hypothetical protein